MKPTRNTSFFFQMNFEMEYTFLIFLDIYYTSKLNYLCISKLSEKAEKKACILI